MPSWVGAQFESSRTTSSAIDSEHVSPGDSMPTRWTVRESPCCCPPSIMKSAAGSPGPVSFGLIPQVGHQRIVRAGFRRVHRGNAGKRRLETLGRSGVNDLDPFDTVELRLLVYTAS